MHVYNAMVNKDTIDYLIYGYKWKTWNKSLRNELVSLAQGKNFGVKFTNTIDFIPRSEIPQGRGIMYDNFVCDYRPLKSEPCQICLVLGGKKLTHEEDYCAPADSLL